MTRADGGLATDLWQQWHVESKRIVAPILIHYEITNALHRLSVAGGLTESALDAYLQAALALPITYAADDDLHLAAVRLARRFNRPASNDAHYLALSERENAEFWTADQRLYNAVHHQLPWVRLVGA